MLRCNGLPKEDSQCDLKHSVELGMEAMLQADQEDRVPSRKRSLGLYKHFTRVRQRDQW